MKKTTFTVGLVALIGLVVSGFNINAVGSFYSALVPVSSMVGQEIWVIMALFVTHYVVLSALSIRFIYQVVKRLITMK